MNKNIKNMKNFSSKRRFEEIRKKKENEFISKRIKLIKPTINTRYNDYFKSNINKKRGDLCKF